MLQVNRIDKTRCAVRYLNEEPDLQAEGTPVEAAANFANLRYSLNSNIALLNIKLEAWADAERAASAALAVDSISEADRAKALYRRGFALVRLRDEDAAVASLEQAKKLAPTDAAIIKELEAVKKQAAARSAKEKAAYKKFFS